MEFSRANMGVIDTTQAEVVKHLREVGHIVRQFFRCYSRVFDDADRFGIAFHPGEQTQACLTQTPHLGDFGAVDA